MSFSKFLWHLISSPGRSGGREARGYEINSVSFWSLVGRGGEGQGGSQTQFSELGTSSFNKKWVKWNRKHQSAWCVIRLSYSLRLYCVCVYLCVCKQLYLMCAGWQYKSQNILKINVIDYGLFSYKVIFPRDPGVQICQRSLFSKDLPNLLFLGGLRVF